MKATTWIPNGFTSSSCRSRGLKFQAKQTLQNKGLTKHTLQSHQILRLQLHHIFCQPQKQHSNIVTASPNITLPWNVIQQLRHMLRLLEKQSNIFPNSPNIAPAKNPTMIPTWFGHEGPHTRLFPETFPISKFYHMLHLPRSDAPRKVTRQLGWLPPSQVNSATSSTVTTRHTEEALEGPTVEPWCAGGLCAKKNKQLHLWRATCNIDEDANMTFKKRQYMIFPSDCATNMQTCVYPGFSAGKTLGIYFRSSLWRNSFALPKTRFWVSCRDHGPSPINRRRISRKQGREQYIHVQLTAPKHRCSRSVSTRSGIQQ